MNIHEYQAKEILKKYGAPTLKGVLVESTSEVSSALDKLGTPAPWVVKAQIHAGGRGKAGGVKLAHTPEEVTSITQELLGKTLVTHQTGPQGKEVLKVYVEEGCKIAKELYVAALVDRATNSVVIMASTEGGMDIEEVAEKTPEKIFKVVIDPVVGLASFQARELGFKLGLEGKSLKNAIKTFGYLYQAFVDTDASIAEINPLVVTEDDEIVVLDAKMNFDSNSLYRQPSILELRDITEEDPAEVEASEHDLAFIKLDGNIGCLVNGAGLAMATMDIIKLHGGEPANFLDVGGGATTEKVTAAFKLILKDPSVKAILVNIFGGIMKCDIIAEGVIAAAKEVGLNFPLVVRLAGTNVEKGKKLLEESGLNIIPASDLGEAAEKVVASIK